MTTRVNFRLPEKLLEKADVTAEATHRDRTEIMKEALREYLGNFENDEDFKQKVVELYLDGELGFDEMKAVIGKQDAESVKATSEILNESDEKASELAGLSEK
ncbi:CopG family ribbon-helix-helix protein [Candidatus Nanohalobium constans]|uniref:Ribbon-helix-helix protein, copG family n=1 Tax=Candidatus Nanohalobium constans TaxID=2565781 RepID=A0A5Q0UH14_9ARCH|nr:ribbon-helix-helix protein, CopG family [Candidatus Nanohalobium constans]QGA80918.1 ribbon-helix-helix protein, copG family [Candidatus Nanohalobium constans]